MVRQQKVLIVYNYHIKETFATKIGEDLFRNFNVPRIQVVKYTGKPEKNRSTRNLRRFIGEFGSSLPIILHNDGKTDTEAIIIYCARSRLEKKKMLRPLFKFVSKYNKTNISVIFDTIVLGSAKHSLVEVEFNHKIGIKKAVGLVMDLSKYLLNF